jgi:hypothetical protein
LATSTLVAVVVTVPQAPAEEVADPTVTSAAGSTSVKLTSKGPELLLKMDKVMMVTEVSFKIDGEE